MQIVIDVTPWDKELMDAEVDLSTLEDAITAQIAHNFHPAKMARMIVASRERGLSDPDILPPNRTALMIGQAKAYRDKLSNKRYRFTAPNGKKLSARRFILPTHGRFYDQESYQAEIDSDEPVLMEVTNPLAAERAEEYIMTQVRDLFRGRMKVVMVSDPHRLLGTTDRAHKMIEEVFDELTNGDKS